MWLIKEKYSKPYSNLHSVVTQYFHNRGITDYDKIITLINCDVSYDTSPFGLFGMKECVDAILLRLRDNQRVVIFGDYDADGVTSTVSLYLALQPIIEMIGSRSTIEYYIPKRNEGYGISVDAINSIKDRCDFIITVDNGIKAFDAIKFAKEIGLFVIVTDHHLPSYSLPVADIIVNPKLKTCNYPNKDLAGCGVVYKLIQALFVSMGCDISRADEWIDLIAIGTVADMMSLMSEENRNIVSRGLKQIRDNPRLSISEFCVSTAHGSYQINHEEADAKTIGFSIAPVINAAGRMENPNWAAKMLLANDAEGASLWSEKLILLNNRRKSKQLEAKNYLLDIIESQKTDFDSMPVICEIYPEQNGMVGLMASDLAKIYNRPAIIFSPGNDSNTLTASGRSIAGMNITSALDECQDLLLRHGGHAMAAGLSLTRDNFDAFKTRIFGIARRDIGKISYDLIFDMEISLSNINWNLYNVLRQLEPTSGEDFPTMTFVTKELEYDKLSVWSNGHLSFYASDDNGNRVACNGWYLGNMKSMIEKCDKIDIAYTIEKTDYKSNIPYLRLSLMSVKPSDSEKEKVSYSRKLLAPRGIDRVR